MSSPLIPCTGRCPAPTTHGHKPGSHAAAACAASLKRSMPKLSTVASTVVATPPLPPAALLEAQFGPDGNPFRGDQSHARQSEFFSNEIMARFQAAYGSSELQEALSRAARSDYADVSLNAVRAGGSRVALSALRSQHWETVEAAIQKARSNEWGHILEAAAADHRSIVREAAFKSGASFSPNMIRLGVSDLDRNVRLAALSAPVDHGQPADNLVEELTRVARKDQDEDVLIAVADHSLSSEDTYQALAMRANHNVAARALEKSGRSTTVEMAYVSRSKESAIYIATTSTNRPTHQRLAKLNNPQIHAALLTNPHISQTSDLHKALVKQQRFGANQDAAQATLNETILDSYLHTSERQAP